MAGDVAWTAAGRRASGPATGAVTGAEAAPVPAYPVSRGWTARATKSGTTTVLPSPRLSTQFTLSRPLTVGTEIWPTSTNACCA
ncbi:hypothetical protein KIV56_13835 [Cryobacterium breve]|uniref:Uncharacterized protein n=1 Tax=Cryobacterium breve TaxID=1259258 RepID=A0ABY7NAD1_9MICO|nr:hypothetical protein [Cryobacterium breve]WBM79436.1 hypothetical protein KIV56_13835 [Cryobacterium breve]